MIDRMILRRLSALTLIALVPAAANGKSSGSTLPSYVLTAHTVDVVIDPQAGVSASDPNANQRAQKDVEAALQKWGRFVPVLDSQQPDLIIVVRKGQGKLVEETVTDPRQNSRPGSVTTTPDTTSVAVQGRQPGPNGLPGVSRGSSPTANPQLEVGSTDDSFTVYRGQSERPPEGPAAWRYIKKNALHPDDVPAVEAFRNAITEAEKQAAKQAGKHP